MLELAAGTGIVTRELLAAVDGAEITAADLDDATAIVTDVMTAQLGAGEVSSRTVAHVFAAS